MPRLGKCRLAPLLFVPVDSGAVFAARCSHPGIPDPGKLYALKVSFRHPATWADRRSNAPPQTGLLVSPHPNVRRTLATFSHPLLTPAAVAEVPAVVRNGLPTFVQQALASIVPGTETAGVPELTVEVADFHTLTLAAARAQEGSPLPPGKLVSWGLDLLRAIVHAGSSRVVHLDIKPDNAFLRADGGGVVLGDWGCAVQCATDAMTRLWEPRDNGLGAGGLLGGARARLAPEVQAAAAVVLVQQQRADAAAGGGSSAAQPVLVPLGKADVWAVGVLLYELALGAHPWPNYPFNGLAASELTGVAGAALLAPPGAVPPPSSSSTPPTNAARAFAWARALGQPPLLPAGSYPDPLRELLRWMVAPNPSQRCSAAGALARLERIAAGARNIVPSPSIAAWQAEAARSGQRGAAAAAADPVGGAPFLLHVSDASGGTAVIPVLPAPQRPPQAVGARPAPPLPVPVPTAAGVYLAKDAAALAWEMLRVGG